MFRKKAKGDIVVSMNITVPEDKPKVAKTYEWQGLILPIVAGKGKRFIALDTHKYSWRYIVIDTKHNVYVPHKESNYDSLVKGNVDSLNEFDADGCTFPWEPKNV